MKNVKQLLEEAGSKLEHICKTTIYITDRAYREAVYREVGKALKGVHPCSTGLIVNGLAIPELLMEIDVEAVIAHVEISTQWIFTREGVESIPRYEELGVARLIVPLPVLGADAIAGIERLGEALARA